MKESFLLKFDNMSDKAHEKTSLCYNTGDYMSALRAYFEKGYYRVLARVVNGQDQRIYKDKEGQTLTPDLLLKIYLNTEEYGTSRVIQILKKIKKTEKTAEVKEAVNRFIDEVSSDFIVLADKSTEIYHTLKGMGTWEKIEKGLDRGVNNPIHPTVKLFTEDEVAMAVMDRLEGLEAIDRLMDKVKEILQ
jgi:hypothetical protein